MTKDKPQPETVTKDQFCKAVNTWASTYVHRYAWEPIVALYPYGVHITEGESE